MWTVACSTGCETVEVFDDWVRRGILPVAMPGTHRWDRMAIDRALDRHSGLVEAAGQPFEEWAAQHAD
ncbi:hypothetical protein DK412_04830 [Methylobacterium sp. 17Sr1-1]|nr:hypothetical protein DK412_04830 [Methylobacterium sp. 17Sr1-1]